MIPADPRVRAPGLVLPPPAAPRMLAAMPADGGARIKERPGDFLVEELPLYEPSGEGEHLYLRIMKEDLSHHEMVRILCGHFGVGPAAVGFAGMKDRMAVTSQTVSVHLPRQPELRAIRDPRIQVLWTSWHVNKLRRGHLAGNRFSVRVRGIEPTRAPAAWRAVKELERAGVPNAFGPQRFGMRGDNHLLGALLLCGRHEELLGALASGAAGTFPESERAARESVDAGRFDEAVRLWPRGLDAERAATRALARGADARTAVGAVPRDVRELWSDAWQSAVFNRLLAGRIADGTVSSVLPGDVAWKHANGAQFLASDEAFAADGDRSLAARAALHEISAAGPLPGFSCLRALGDVERREREAIAAFGVDPVLFDGSGSHPAGGRRPYRVRLSNPEIESGFDGDGPYVRVAFDLPAGAYATAVLREAFGDSVAAVPGAAAP